MSNGKSDYEWQKFADKNGLTFKYDNINFLNIFFSTKTYVVGDYYGYNVRLDTYTPDKYKKPFFSDMVWQDTPLKQPRKQVSTRMVLKAGKSDSTLTSVSKTIPRKNFDVDLLLPAEVQRNVKGKLYATDNGRTVIYEQGGFENNVEYLQFVLDLLKDLIEVYPDVVGWGGEAVPVLVTTAKSNYLLQHIARQLLFDIGKDTEKRFRKQAPYLLCPECWVHYGAHDLNVSWTQYLTYYGCRVCGQSRRYLPVDDRRLIALLDRESTTEKSIGNDQIRVNWIEHRRLFDFDEVEIIRATDEDVERFAVQVGNDTDPFRDSCYKQMCCTISAGCGLSENTVRILRQTFGQVEMK